MFGKDAIAVASHQNNGSGIQQSWLFIYLILLLLSIRSICDLFQIELCAQSSRLWELDFYIMQY